MATEQAHDTRCVFSSSLSSSASGWRSVVQCMTRRVISAAWRMAQSNKIVFFVDVHDTLLDNDRIQDDLKRHLERENAAA